MPWLGIEPVTPCLTGGCSVHWATTARAFCPLFNWVVCLLGVDLCEYFIYFGDQTLIQGIIGKYVFPYSWYSFHFNAVFFFFIFLGHVEAFYLDEISFVYTFLESFSLEDILVKILLCGISEIFLLMFSSRILMLLWLIFKSFIHLECVFGYGVSSIHHSIVSHRHRK